jgi:hypothetical protein
MIPNINNITNANVNNNLEQIKEQSQTGSEKEERKTVSEISSVDDNQEGNNFKLYINI